MAPALLLPLLELECLLCTYPEVFELEELRNLCVCIQSVGEIHRAQILRLSLFDELEQQPRNKAVFKVT